MSDHKLIDIFTETGLSSRVANPSRIERDKIIDSAFDRHGNLRVSALGVVLMTRDFEIVGSASTGTNVVIPRRMPQGGRAVRLDAVARNAPVGGPFIATLYADGAPVGSVSLPSGETSGGSNVSTTIPPGAVLTWNVTAANSAANVCLTLVYRVG